jgi:ketosteroid isomerase-like protein
VTPARASRKVLAGTVRCGVSLDDSVRLIRRYGDALNAGDLAALDELVGDDFVIHQPSGDRRGKGAMRGFVAGVRRLLPDIDARIEAVVADDASADGHRVGVVLVYQATNARLGRRVTVRELQLYRVVGGKIAERWYAADRRAAGGGPPTAS